MVFSAAWLCFPFLDPTVILVYWDPFRNWTLICVSFCKAAWEREQTGFSLKIACVGWNSEVVVKWDKFLNYPNATLSLSSEVACFQPERFKSDIR